MTDSEVALYDVLVDRKVFYVGVSKSPRIRLNNHRSKGVVPFRCKLRIVAWYRSRDEALVAEAARISKLKPPGNIVGNPLVAVRKRVKRFCPPDERYSMYRKINGVNSQR